MTFDCKGCRSVRKPEADGHARFRVPLTQKD